MSIDEEEEDIGDEKDDGVANIDCRERKKGKKPLICWVKNPSTLRQPWASIQNSSSSNTKNSDPIHASILPRKTKIVMEIHQKETYEEDYGDSVSFALFSHSDRIHFEEVVKKMKWCNPCMRK